MIRSELEADPGPVRALADLERFSQEDLGKRQLPDGKSWLTLDLDLRTRFSDDDRSPLQVFHLVVGDIGFQALRKVLQGPGSSQIVEIAAVRLPRDNDHSPIFVDGSNMDFERSVAVSNPASRRKDNPDRTIVMILAGGLTLTATGTARGHGYSDGA